MPRFRCRGCQAATARRVIRTVSRIPVLHSFLVAGLVLAAAAPAAQADTIAPPGNAGAQEYLEAVPTAGGGKVGGSSGKPSSGTLSKRDQSSLKAQGSDGSATAALAEASAPAPSHKSSSGKAHHRQSKSAPASASSDSAPSEGGPSLAAASAKTVGGKGGMGVALPIVLAVALACAAGVALLRRRSRAS